MKTKTYLKYFHCLKKGHVWTEQEIIYFRKYINGSSSISEDEVHSLLEKMSGKTYRITDQQSVKGILWLKNQCFKQNGGIRKSCPFGNFEVNVIKHFREFRFVGVFNISQNSYRQYMPIYRTIAKDGSYFDYVAYSWGQIEVLNIRPVKASVWAAPLNRGA